MDYDGETTGLMAGVTLVMIMVTLLQVAL